MKGWDSSLRHERESERKKGKIKISKSDDRI